ncbi:MAG: outer membrane beta-barrel protein [Bacillota bacterium]
MQKPFSRFVLPALLALSAPVHADDAPTGPFHVGLDVGHVSVDYGSLSLTPANAGVINGTGTAETLFFGYDLNEYLGVELAYHDYGKPTTYEQRGSLPTRCPASFSCPQVTGLSAEVLGRYEVADHLDGELRVGALDWRVGSPGSMLFAHTTGTELIYGVGVVRHFDYGLNLDITYERSTFTTEETRVGLSYSF